MEQEKEHFENLSEESRISSPPPPTDTAIDLVQKTENQNLNSEETKDLAAENGEDSEEVLVDEINKDSSSFTKSTILITKSQLVENEFDNTDMIESTIEVNQTEQENPELTKSTTELVHEETNEITQNLNEQKPNILPMEESCFELSNEINKEINSIINDLSAGIIQENPVVESQQIEPVSNEDLTNSCVDLGSEFKMPENALNPVEEKLIEQTNEGEATTEQSFLLTTSCVDLGEHSVDLNAKETLSDDTVQVSEKENQNYCLTSSCVDLGNPSEDNGDALNAKAHEESNHDNSMEIIDSEKKEDEEYEITNATDLEKPTEVAESVEDVVKSQKPQRKLEDEVYEKPLGGGSLMKKIIQYGEEINNRDHRPSSGQMCTINYEAFLKDTTTLVEKSEELSFILGDGDVISAIDLVVSLMSKNEKCEIITESRHAYGAIGKKPDIPPHATLTYIVHLKDFKDLVELNSMEPLERISLAEAKKLRGNFHFNRQDFHQAGFSYKKGLKYFDEENLKGTEEKIDLDKIQELKKALLMNLALSNFKQNDYKMALNSLNEVLKSDSTHMKALYIKGKVLMQLSETQEAIECLTKAHELAQDNTEVKNELLKAQAKHKIQYEKEKKMYQKMINGVSKPAKPVKEKASSNKKESSPFVSYAVAGILLAAASVGIALLAKSKNLI